MLKRTTNQDRNFVLLREALDKELWIMYPELLKIYVAHNILPESTSAVLYYEDGQPLACGAFKPKPDLQAIEVKRMYVLPAARGQGLGKAILDGLEEWGREMEYKKSVLETGHLNFAAHVLYQRSGYERIKNYPPFEGMESSWCYGKML